MLQVWASARQRPAANLLRVLLCADGHTRGGAPRCCPDTELRTALLKLATLEQLDGYLRERFGARVRHPIKRNVTPPDTAADQQRQQQQQLADQQPGEAAAAAALPVQRAPATPDAAAALAAGSKRLLEASEAVADAQQPLAMQPGVEPAAKRPKADEGMQLRAAQLPPQHPQVLLPLAQQAAAPPLSRAGIQLPHMAIRFLQAQQQQQQQQQQQAELPPQQGSVVAPPQSSAPTAAALTRNYRCPLLLRASAG